jgi:hypothetical protein
MIRLGRKNLGAESNLSPNSLAANTINLLANEVNALAYSRTESSLALYWRGSRNVAGHRQVVVLGACSVMPANHNNRNT